MTYTTFARVITRSLLAVLLCSGLVSNLYAQAHSEDQDSHETEHADHAESVELNDKLAALTGVTTATATAGPVHQLRRVYGRLQLPADARVQVAARYPGVIQQLTVMPGDGVSKGDLLARIEANSSLQTYPVRAPISGQVIAVTATVGESVSDTAFITIVNKQQLWANLRVFPSHQQQLHLGQTALVFDEDATYTRKISRLIPKQGQTPYLQAGIKLDNHKGRWLAGEVIRAAIVVAEEQVPVRVHKSAIQQIDGQPVVFVAEGDEYHKRVISKGMQGHQFVEVVSGLNAGETYVVSNSYVFKAELEKASAAHSH